MVEGPEGGEVDRLAEWLAGVVNETIRSLAV